MATLDKVAVDITVVLGTTSMPVHQVLRPGRGAIIELDASEEDAVSILANNLPVAKGTVVVNGNRIAVNVAGAASAAPRYALNRPLQGPEACTEIKSRRGRRGPCPSTSYLLHGPPSLGRGGFRPSRPSPQSMIPKGGTRLSDKIMLGHMRPWRNW